jgi:hypothetical protein
MNSHLTVFVIFLSLVLAAQLFAGMPQEQADAPAVGQTSPQSAQKNSKHSTPTKVIKYVNTKYGFTFSLPATWKGYSVAGDSRDSAAGETSKGPSNLLR